MERVSDEDLAQLIVERGKITNLTSFDEAWIIQLASNLRDCRIALGESSAARLDLEKWKSEAAKTFDAIMELIGTFGAGTWAKFSDVMDAVEISHNDSVAALASLRAQVEARSGECFWTQDEQDGDMWETSCGKAWVFNEGSPADNEMKFCHSCGRVMKQFEYKRDEDDDDPGVSSLDKGVEG